MNVYGSTFLVCIVANSGKVKRIRINDQINIAPCKSECTLIGAWVVADAHKAKDRATFRKVDHLLDKKYVLMKIENIPIWKLN